MDRKARRRETLNGENVGGPFTLNITEQNHKYVLKNKYANPALWNCEDPNLYQVVVSIKKNEKIVHAMRLQNPLQHIHCCFSGIVA